MKPQQAAIYRRQSRAVNYAIARQGQSRLSSVCITDLCKRQHGDKNHIPSTLTFARQSGFVVV